MRHSYHVVDVFTDTALAGNPLAVVLDAGDIPSDRCQAIAREFNLSETVFVEDPRDPVNTARLRIFTPMRELPFAGHPTVGTAALLALLRAPEILLRQDLSVVLEESIGPIECTVRRVRGQVRASFTLPKLPVRSSEALTPEVLARALGLPSEAIGMDGHAVGVFSAGVPFHCVPVRPGAMAQCRPNIALWPDLLPPDGPQAIFVYSRDIEAPSSAYRARMFSPAFGIGEDPATGSAVAAFAGAVMAYERPTDGDHTLVIEQGYEMGRPSLITLGLNVENGALVSASIGGGTVRIAEGTLHL
ncbi:PhzF family phenazine biosynthesis protein [Lichenifustis flavocetrariae]|uniref:PhzF family phenazine biosynthesis protein n=1 Tax=Lichenifustis flavocetrariae TaxID=2949735 RepID=A0AA41YU22_9HYPH|nr:PhzF family phenazine biosynthesis protein [Lichenifustis flavocetrariae]MCW6508579.1 PhzF family phenazine biosynthesis protein [Lichenifustis flavocetrariae]